MRTSTLGAALAALAGMATAAPPPAARNAQAVDGIRSCRGIAASDQRLACYDAAATALDAAIEKHDITVLDRQEVVRTRRSLFGFTLPNLKLFGAGEQEAGGGDQKTLDTSIASVRSVSYGKYAITTPEDAVWQNTDLMDFAPRPGDKLHFQRGAIGSYFMRVGSDRPVRAMRVR